jgi:hypothetical protein
MKLFTFEFSPPTLAIPVLHFQARDVSTGEVVVTVNGKDVGLVPGDTIDADRKLELVIDPGLLNKGEPNLLVFDNVRNPPNADPWRIWNVWLEVAVAPEP